MAQATWAAQKLGVTEFDPQVLELPGSFEARALDWLKGGQIEAAIADTWKWHGDQFFSPTPAIFGSYLASVGLANYEEVLRFVEEGRTYDSEPMQCLRRCSGLRVATDRSQSAGLP